MRILLADDENTILVTLGDALASAGHHVVTAARGDRAAELLAAERFEVLITDLRLPGTDGMELLRRGRAAEPPVEVIVVTGYGTVESAVEAMERGAHTYLQKPFLNEDVLARLGKIEELLRLRAENARLRAEAGQRYRLDQLVGQSPAMQELFDQIEMVAPKEVSVLLCGESGTGKELVARALHHNSPRKNQPLVRLSCAALPGNLLEDELFGHEKGAFTDARERRAGRFELADGGTIFLDDIDDLPLPLQVKLLRVLQEREFERLGGSETLQVNIRIIAATKADLRQLVRQGRFREDLFYRLDVVTLRLPPLRDRPHDLPLLCQHFIARHGGGKKYTIEEAAMRELLAYSWPGNVRELEHAIQRAIALAGDSGVLERRFLLPEAAADAPSPTGELAPLKEVINRVEAEHLRYVLTHTRGNRTQAAEILGISRKNLWEKMKEHGL